MSPWSYLCDVDVAELQAFVPFAKWPPVKGGQPNRVKLPAEALPAIETVLACFPPGASIDRYRACLSRLVPGATYELHRDPQAPNWITRVHVPVVTNPGAWMCFKGTGRVHFEAGKAYSFDTLVMHNYGNDGDTDRVHLLFDVLRG